MTEADWPLVLLGVFRALQARRVSLGVPDYLDAIVALRRGYPWSETIAGPSGRDDLRRLCKMLWARDDAQARLVDELFGRLLPVSSRYQQELQASRLLRAQDARDGPEEDPTRFSASPSEIRSGSTPALPDGRRARVDFSPLRDEGGLDLARLSGTTGLDDQTYALEPETVLSARALAVLFRRFRVRGRAGARTELDLAGTIEERCRRGVATALVFRAPLMTRAPLIVLADTSASMTSWLPFLGALAQALDLSRLASVRLCYFGNLPDPLVYDSPHLEKATPLDDLLAAMPGAPVLVISDAGAARGTVRASRVRVTLSVLDRLARERRRVAWLNPMPRARWPGTSAGVIAARSRGAAFLALDPSGQALVCAIDILRGAREGRDAGAG